MTFGNPEGYADGYTCRDTIMCAWWNAEQQKCAVLVIAPEPKQKESSGLDSATRGEIWQLLHYIMHEAGDAEMCEIMGEQLGTFSLTMKREVIEELPRLKAALEKEKGEEE